MYGLNIADFYSDVSYGAAFAAGRRFGYITLLQQTRTSNGKYKVTLRKKK